MEKAVVVRGKMSGPRRVELDEPVDELDGPVEVVLRPSAGSSSNHRDVFDLIASMPPGGRTKEDIDRQIADDRSEWADE
ncbi:MAG: hypothetical protein HY897_09985 [Deltaproteobacteria bacterium]|nr:hypothetical protein [Deltaproteobacteria bacterium]